jgi:imidazolonepropionase-like amidohydrolase
MSEYVLHNLLLLDPAAGACVPGQLLHVRDGRFAAVAPAIDAAPSVPRVDLGGRVVMPGLIDCHVHVTSIRTQWANKSLMFLPTSFTNAATTVKLRRMLHRGFTTVRDAGGADRGHREAVGAGLIDGPRLFVSGRSISQTGGHGDQRNRVDQPAPCGCFHFLNGVSGSRRVADGVAEVQRAVRDEIRLGADQIKIQAGGGVGSPADPIHFVQYSIEELEAAVEEAENADTYVLAHAYTAKAIKRSVAAGIRTIEHGNFLDAEAADLMAQRGTILVPTLVAYEATMKHGREQGYPEENLKKNAEVLATGAKSLQIARAAGVTIAFGTDLIGELDGFQCDEFAIRARTLSNADVIRSATLTAAKVVRQEGQLGVIAAGAHADLLVLEADPLHDIGILASAGAGLCAVVKGGRAYKDELNFFSGLA